ncbi:hypothetical protein Chor_002806 [Crotalus horridus]
MNSEEWFRVTALLVIAQAVSTMVLPNTTVFEDMLEKYMDEDGEWWIAKQRGKRAITDNDMRSILDIHNKLRGQVYPQASNMEYMTWDPELERSAKSWAETCLWEHGPASLLPSIGQNLGAHWGRYRPLTFHVQSWGNWWGHAPYKHGRPCSECPPSFGGGCRENLCYKEGSERYYSPEIETNEVEQHQLHVRNTLQNQVQPQASPRDVSERNEVISKQQMSQIVSCELRLRDQCKGTTCNRYECPSGCLDSSAKVVGSVYYDMQSSICRAAIHYGILDNDGGWVDVTRLGRRNYFIKSYRNGVQSVGKYQSANSFTVSKVTVQAITCETTVEQLCPFYRPATHCPRVRCPHNCMQANPHYARVIGTIIYSDMSSICRTAVHAGVIRNEGGFVDVMPVDKKRIILQEAKHSEYLQWFEDKKMASIISNANFYKNLILMRFKFVS